MTAYFALGDTYRRLKILDSSLSYDNKGLKLSKNINNKKQVAYFLLNKGATLFDKKQYQTSIKTLKQALPDILKTKDNPNKAMLYFFLGRNKEVLKDNLKAVHYYKKVDSLFLIMKDIHPELRNGFEYLVKYYNNKNNTKQELFYINRLLNIDSIINTNYKFLSKKIVQEFDTPQLISQKNILIANMQLKEKNNKKIVIFSLTSLLLVIILYAFNYKKNKKRLNILLDSINKSEKKK